jgi:hypothetical protein
MIFFKWKKDTPLKLEKKGLLLTIVTFPPCFSLGFGWTIIYLVVGIILKNYICLG